MAADKEKSPPQQGDHSSPRTKSRVATKKAAATKSASGEAHNTKALAELQESLQALAQQSRQRYEAQEEKLAELMQGLERAFDNIHRGSSEQTQRLGTLMIGLEKAFLNIHAGTQLRDRGHNSSLEQVSQTIIRSSEQLRKEYEEMERLQQQLLEAEKERHSHAFRQLKVVAVPAMVLALFGIGYMFYTVTVMERAMTAMSQDMHSMRTSMGEMTTAVGEMNSNMQLMRRDLTVMTRNVAPAMDGMRRMMPWAP